MIKKIFNYQLFLLLVLFFIFLILFGGLLRHHYVGGQKVENLQKIAVFIAEIPYNTRYFFINLNKTQKKDVTDIIQIINDDFVTPIDNTVYDEKKKFQRKIITSEKKEELVLVSRHDGDLGRSIVELRDINNFEVLHSYVPDIRKIYEIIEDDPDKYANLEPEWGFNRFFMNHPQINSKGDLIFHSSGPLVQIDIDSRITWVQSDKKYHHSINTDIDGMIYVCSYLSTFSKKVSEYIGITNYINRQKNYLDDAITILDNQGNEIFTKSISEILIENGLVGRLFSQSIFWFDPIHLNDIEPVLKDTKYFKKGDVFLSLRNLSMVILYRPSTNKIIKIIEGDFYNQHDVDILDDSTISIYNNNVFYYPENNGLGSASAVKNNNEIILYNFDTNTFSKKFQSTFEDNKISTQSAGIIDFLNDGSAVIEETDNGKIYYIDSSGEIIWEYVNLSSQKQLYDLWWLRVIDAEKSAKLRKILKKNDL